MINNFHIISYTTDNFKPLTDIFLESCYKIGIPLTNIHIKYDRLNYNKEESSFRGLKWYSSILSKMQYVIDTLKKLCENERCKYFIVSDCDVWFIQNNKSHWTKLELYLETSSKDIFFMPEFVGDDTANGGFYIIKNNHNLSHIISFFENIYEIMKNNSNENMPFGDQTLINQHKKSIKYDYIPKKYLIWGPIVGDNRRSLIHHAVCAANLEEKLSLIESIKQRYNLS